MRMRVRHRATYPNGNVLLVIVPSPLFTMPLVRPFLTATITLTALTITPCPFLLHFITLGYPTPPRTARCRSPLPHGDGCAPYTPGCGSSSNSGIAGARLLRRLLSGGLFIAANGMLARKPRGGTETTDFGTVATASRAVDFRCGMSDAGNGGSALFPLVLARRVAVLVLVFEEAGDAHETVLTREPAHAAKFTDHDTGAGHRRGEGDVIGGGVKLCVEQ